MSSEAVRWVMDCTHFKGSEFMVLVALAEDADKEGRGAFPSQERIARRARVSRSTVQRKLRMFERLGWIYRGDQSKTKGHHVRKPVVWDLNLSRVTVVSPDDDPLAGVREAGVREGAPCPRVDRVEAVVPEENVEPVVEPVVDPVESEAEPVIESGVESSGQLWEVSGEWLDPLLYDSQWGIVHPLPSESSTLKASSKVTLFDENSQHPLASNPHDFCSLSQLLCEFSNFGKASPMVMPETRIDLKKSFYSETPKKMAHVQQPTGVAAAYDETFEAFWKLYPRKTAKRGAWKAWLSAIKRADVDTIMAGAERYRNDPNRVSTYTCHASTWLNQDRWDDEPLPDRTAFGAKPLAGETASWYVNNVYGQPDTPTSTQTDWGTYELEF